MITRPPNVSWLTWQIWGLRDLRDDALGWLQERGVPPLMLVPVTRLPRIIGTAEYVCKFEWHQAPLFVLKQANFDAWRWLN